jgi:hypothetical protein
LTSEVPSVVFRLYAKNFPSAVAELLLPFTPALNDPSNMGCWVAMFVMSQMSHFPLHPAAYSLTDPAPLSWMVTSLIHCGSVAVNVVLKIGVAGVLTSNTLMMAGAVRFCGMNTKLFQTAIL